MFQFCWDRMENAVVECEASCKKFITRVDSIEWKINELLQFKYNKSDTVTKLLKRNGDLSKVSETLNLSNANDLEEEEITEELFNLKNSLRNYQSQIEHLQKFVSNTGPTDNLR